MTSSTHPGRLISVNNPEKERMERIMRAKLASQKGNADNMIKRMQVAQALQANAKQPDGIPQYCLHQINKTNRYRLLKSITPQLNAPGDYSVTIAEGTVEELIQFRQEMREGRRDEDGRVR